MKLIRCHHKLPRIGVLVALLLLPLYTGRAQQPPARPITSPRSPFNAPNSDGFTPLMEATANTDIIKVQQLLKQGANVDERSRNRDGNTALLIALFNGGVTRSLEIAKILIAAGAAVRRANTEGQQPMHYLMQVPNEKARMELLHMLIDRGANVNAQNNEGNTLLFVAAEMRDKYWFRAMKDEYGSMINWAMRNKKGQTVLQRSRELLLTFGEDSVISSIESPYVVVGSRSIKDTDKQGRNGLMLAVLRADGPFADRMLKERIDVNARDSLGNTALHYAVLSTAPAAMVGIVLAANPAINVANNRGDTPLHLVTMIQNPDEQLATAKQLVNAQANINAVNGNGDTVMHLAVRAGATELVRYMSSASVTPRNKQGLTPLELARQKNDGQLVRALSGAQ